MKRDASNGGTFDQGIEQIVAAVLVSPQFLYRSIRGPKGVTPDTEFALTDLELASRLSFFLWNTGPDEELLTLAAANGLTRPGAMEKQVRRMLADPRASSLVTSFAMKWLNLTNLDQVVPDPKLFPGFDEQLRHDFSTEAEAFIGSIFSDDRSVLELLTADYTFLNERLARHYGISGVTGAQFRKVTLARHESREARFGLLGKAAVLLRTSYGDRTSPVLRGAWVLDKLMGTPPTPPPPDTATDLSQKAGEQPKTVRARLEQHRDKASCRMCHGVIDPTGLALGKFRRDRAMADDGQPGERSDRCQHGAADRSRDQRCRGTQGATGRAPGSVRADRDGEIDDVRRQSPTGIFRYASGSRHRARRPRKTTTSCLRSSWESSTATRSASRARGRRRSQRALKWLGDNMFITKKHIPRRAVLKAAGVTLGLPFLDAMVPAGTALAQTAAVPKLRTGFFYLPHGAIMGNTSHGPAMDKWTPSGSGANFKLSPILASLEPYKKYVSSFGGPGERRHGGLGSFVHSRHMAQRHPSGYRQLPARTWPRLSIR